jgi:hypothetical protein
MPESIYCGIAIGGCAYRSMVHCAHAASLAEFAVECRDDDGAVLAEIAYQHTSNLPQGRSLWLRDRIRGECDVAVTVDSDTAYDARSMLRGCQYMRATEFACPDIAIGIAPVIRVNRRGFSLNIFHAPGEPLAPSACGGGHPDLWAGGFGVAVFNLAWFRRNWTDPYPESFGIPSDSINQGEDIQMCRSVANRGGRIIPLWVPTTHYDMTGSVVVGESLGYLDGRMVVGDSGRRQLT